jgi:hypothetical protein
LKTAAVTGRPSFLISSVVLINVREVSVRGTFFMLASSRQSVGKPIDCCQMELEKRILHHHSF